ncbi:MAG: hypothetical protein IPM96_16475 [Ignavibacteria bacterium]|nr:hypothetical protein [Ignavibacteria bacterium]
MHTQNETIKIEKNGKVFLILPNKKFKPSRCIGYIRNRTFHTLKKDNHLFRQFNAFGLNYKFLSEGEKFFDYIEIEYNFGKLITTRRYYLANGSFKHYQQNDLEKQIFLPLELYGMERALSWEKEQSKKQREAITSKNTYVIQHSMF